MPLFSIVIPTYKRPAYLKKSIESLLEQTNQNFEIIVVDDNNDNDKEQALTEEVVRELNNSKILYVKNLSNKGANYSRNRGIALASGEFIALLDDDDVFDCSKLETIDTFIQRDPHVNFIYSAFEILYYETGRSVVRFENIAKKKVKREILSKNFIGSNSFVVFKKKLWEAVGRFDETLSSSQDWDLWIRMVFGGAVMYAISKPLVRYTVHPGEDRITRNYAKRISGYSRVCEKYFPEVRDMSLVDRNYILSRQSKNRLKIHYENNMLKAFRSEFYSHLGYHALSWKIIVKILFSYFKRRLQSIKRYA